jgi:hypothetical protein
MCLLSSQMDREGLAGGPGPSSQFCFLAANLAGVGSLESTEQSNYGFSNTARKHTCSPATALF